MKSSLNQARHAIAGGTLLFLASLGTPKASADEDRGVYDFISEARENCGLAVAEHASMMRDGREVISMTLTMSPEMQACTLGKMTGHSALDNCDIFDYHAGNSSGTKVLQLECDAPEKESDNQSNLELVC
ncbi:MAG: hypothetical protein OEY44_03975 [Candidatus Peregrinibacteria bacterium]|nr:hypothetical protein [Candidatus Peregrinibacteria bacterium]